MELSFIIPTLHDFPAIIHTVNSIQSEMVDTGLKYEIIVVENGEVDPYTEKFLGAYRVPISKQLIRYFFEPHQCGPAARWKGIQEARGKYTLTMDSHTELGKDSVLHMIGVFEDNDAGTVHGTTVKTHWVPPHVRGAHYRLFGNRGQNLNMQFQGAYSRPATDEPYPCVGANLAYFLQDREEMLKVKGYHPACKYQPHPEGYLPLKYLMFGRQPWIDLEAYHFHSIYRMQNEYRKYLETVGQFQRKKWMIDIEGDPYGLVGQDHFICNAMICSYTLGGDKWLDIVHNSWKPKIRSGYALNGIKEYAKKVSQGERDYVLDNAEYTLDEVLIQARKDRVQGMENWFFGCGPDPIA